MDSEVIVTPASTDQTPVQPVTPPVTPEPVVCELCGHTHGQPVKLTDEEDRKEVLRAVLGRRPFRKRYTMFNGEFEVILRTLMTSEQVLLTTLETTIRNLLEGQAVEVVRGEISRLRLLFYIEKLGDKLLPKPSVSMTTEEVRKLAQEAFSDTHFALLQKVTAIQVAFIDLYEQIIEEGFDANFYKGAGRI